MRQAQRFAIGLAVLTLVGWAGLEMATHAFGKRAARDLRTALRQGDLPERTPPAAAAAARRADLGAVDAGRFDEVAAAWSGHVANTPSAAAHRVAGRALLAAGQAEDAARHAQWAARLEPDSVVLAAEAERTLDVALLHRVRAPLRVAGPVVLGLLLLGAFAGAGGHCRERRRRRYLEHLSGRVRFHVDGQPEGATARLDPETEALTLDVFVKGRYGMARPRCPGRGPTLHLTFSHAGESRTVRLRPVRDARRDAHRVHVRPETLAEIVRHPGTWRLAVRLDERTVALADVEVVPVHSPARA